MSYRLHDSQLAWKALWGGRKGEYCDMKDWATCEVQEPERQRQAARWDHDSYVNGEGDSRSQILYWPVSAFRPLASLWREAARPAAHQQSANKE